jgi:hypothetical protein
MVTVPVVPPIVPEVVPDGMLMMAELLDVNVVELVTGFPFNVAVNETGVFIGFVARLIVVPKLEVMVSEVDWPTVRVMVPETTEPLEDCAAACTVAVVPAGVTFLAVARPAAFTLTKSGFEVTLQVALPVRFLWLPSSYVPVACSWTVLPTFCNVVDCNVDTDMLVSTGSTKNPWQPTAAAIRRRTPKDAISWSLRRQLDIDEKPSFERLMRSVRGKRNCSRPSLGLCSVCGNRMHLRVTTELRLPEFDPAEVLHHAVPVDSHNRIL